MKDYKKMGRKMDSPRGVCSYKKNPLKAPKQVKSKMGPGSNPDQAKANMLLQKAYKESDSLRGKMGM